MRICMFLMTEFTHDARVTKEARSLIKQGHSVTVMALKDKHTPLVEKREDFHIQRVNVASRYVLPKGGVFFFLKYLEFIIRTYLLVKNQNYDVYHAHDLETLPVAYMLAKKNNKPIVYDSHELYIDCVQHGRLQRQIWYHIEKTLAHRVNYTIHENPSRAKIYSERYQVPEPVAVMNCQYLNLKDKTNRFREELSISPDDAIVLYQGLVAPGRGVDVLLDMMNHLENTVLIIMGQGEYKSKLRNDLKQHPQKEKIFILDAVSWNVLAEYTASADIGVSALQNESPQHYYALSNKLFEFLSSGLPVVFSDFPEMRRVIINNNVGLVVDETNPQEIAAAIHKILSDKKLYSEMSRNAKRIIKQRYNWEIEAQKLLAIYDDIIERNVSK